eukprot:IDg22276t1
MLVKAPHSISKPLSVEIGDIALSKLTPAEIEECMKEGRCLRCRENVPTGPNLAPLATIQRQYINRAHENADPFTPAENSVLIAEAEVAGACAKVLIDLGAELNYIFSEFCKRHRIVLQKKCCHATMANKSQQKLGFT